MKGSLICAGLGLAVSAWAQGPAFGTATLAASLTTPAPACVAQEPVANWDAAAQLIAGANSAAYAASFSNEQKSAWADYAKTATADWGRLKRRYVDRIAAWRGKYLAKSPVASVVFYPFSGPDATNPLAFFPDAREYVLAGLEPPGCIPSQAEAFTPEYWPALRQGWQSAAALGFFKTDDMKHDLAQGNAGGVLPVLLFLISRAGNSIVDVSQIGITPAGTVAASADHSPAQAVEVHGVAIRFKDAQHGERTLRYFAVNLQNSRLSRRPGVAKYLENLPAGATLVKSASYLMHRRYFSQVRGIILAKSNLVIEDDSGVPYHYFDPATWDVRLFGTYDTPIDLFKEWVQEDLQAAYQSGDGVQPLDFGISYKWRPGESNLLVATRHGK